MRRFAMWCVLTVVLVAAMCPECRAENRAADVVAGLMERLSPGLSEKMDVAIAARVDSADYFRLSMNDGRPLIEANNAVSAAMGLNWYLKYVARRHMAWDGDMKARLPEVLPAVTEVVEMSTDMPMRYYLNYCTHSYSMAFWDWERWEREIDWMALHGINMPLAVTGSEELWRCVLRRLGYPEAKITDFVAGPAFQAWWLMNNLEGWGGPDSQEQFERQAGLQRRILGRMREYGMEPVMAGYSGMVPDDAALELVLDVKDPGKWLGYVRPAFLQPSDKDFRRVARVYYEVLDSLYGKARYYSMDPFHEGGNTDGVDLGRAGREIMGAMKEHNPDAVWVIQGWRQNPRREMIDSLPAGDMVVLDLHAETEPMWSGRPGGFGHHEWLYCMLHNFGGNVGLYGRMPEMCSAYPHAADSSSTLRGIGLTMEGIETNPVVYELMTELPWRKGVTDARQWIDGYVRARYGHSAEEVDSAWHLLLRSVYDCPAGNTQQGTAESVFCARPSDNPRQASAWAQTTPYYDPQDVYTAARLLTGAADGFASDSHYVYDMVDVVRQAVADKGREVAARFSRAAAEGDRDAYSDAAGRFLRLMELQDRLLGTVSEFRLGRWIADARRCAADEAEKDRYEWNARVQVTVWGTREASERGKLHDYAHREWQGLLADFYRPRWQRWFDARLESWDSGTKPKMDFYADEEPWTRMHNVYDPAPEGDPVAVVREILDEALSI